MMSAPATTMSWWTEATLAGSSRFQRSPDAPPVSPSVNRFVPMAPSARTQSRSARSAFSGCIGATVKGQVLRCAAFASVRVLPARPIPTRVSSTTALVGRQSTWFGAIRRLRRRIAGFTNGSSHHAKTRAREMLQVGGSPDCHILCLGFEFQRTHPARNTSAIHRSARMRSILRPPACQSFGLRATAGPELSQSSGRAASVQPGFG